jgi:peptide/nickel transport system permease protein
MAGLGSTQEDIEKLRQDLGLADPLPQQYVRFVVNALRGDFGRSLHTKEPVLDVVLKRMAASTQLALVGMAVMLGIGIPAGIIGALRRNSWLDNVMTMLVLGIYSVPPFWLGLLLMLIFALRLRWFPATGTGSMRHLILPALAVGASSAAIVARFMRSSLMQVLGEDYIRTARAKGARPALVIVRHALRNALIPVVTVAGLQFGLLLGRSVVIETVFAYAGIGRLLLLSIQTRDLPLLQGAVFFMAIGIVLINLVTDLAYAWLDPRIRL